MERKGVTRRNRVGRGSVRSLLLLLVVGTAACAGPIPSVTKHTSTPLPVGAIAQFPLPGDHSLPGGIAAGPDGALWFTEYVAGRIGRITAGGAVTEFPLPQAQSAPGSIATGPDGALWFTESAGN